jgi:hypothetical protein
VVSSLALAGRGLLRRRARLGRRRHCRATAPRTIPACPPIHLPDQQPTTGERTYLKSTGLPSLLVDPHDPSSSHVAVYAQLWDQTRSEAVDTLIRLYSQAVHTVAAPRDDKQATGDNSRQVP